MNGIAECKSFPREVGIKGREINYWEEGNIHRVKDKLIEEMSE